MPLVLEVARYTEILAFVIVSEEGIDEVSKKRIGRNCVPPPVVAVPIFRVVAVP